MTDGYLFASAHPHALKAIEPNPEDASPSLLPPDSELSGFIEVAAIGKITLAAEVLVELIFKMMSLGTPEPTLIFFMQQLDPKHHVSVISRFAVSWE